jgi:hypothetical protein
MIAAAVPAAVVAQTSGKGSDTSKKSEGGATKSAPTAKKDAGKPDDAAAPAEPEAAAKQGSIEIYKDPRAEAALGKLTTVGRDCPPKMVAEVKAMAGGSSTVERDTIRRFVEGMAYRLTDKSNVNALIGPPRTPPSKAARAIQEAADNLIDPLNSAKAAKNTAFLNVYNQELMATLPKLLENHLVPRIEAMIILAYTGSPAAVPTFLKELKDPNQTAWVKLWAARGLSNVVENGVRVDAVLAAQQAIDTGKVIADFLEREKDSPWPAQMRALEALGAMRQASTAGNQQKAEMAATAMRFLADAEGRPEVRAAAGWALGMIRVNPAIAKYNFGLIAYHLGLLSAELGEKIDSSFNSNPNQSEYLTGLLVTPIAQAFNGVEGARESGLLHVPSSHPSIGPSQSFIKQVSDHVLPVAKAAVELVRVRGTGQVPARKKDLSERVASLKSFLDKSAPKDFHLVPGGPEYRPSVAQTAAAPVEKAKVAGAARGK